MNVENACFTINSFVLGEFPFQLRQGLLLLLQMALGCALLNVGGVVVGFAQLQLQETFLLHLRPYGKFKTLNLSSTHEECVEFVWVTFEKESLGRVLVQDGDWIVHL